MHAQVLPVRTRETALFVLNAHGLEFGHGTRFNRLLKGAVEIARGRLKILDQLMPVRNLFRHEHLLLIRVMLFTLLQLRLENNPNNRRQICAALSFCNSGDKIS